MLIRRKERLAGEPLSTVTQKSGHSLVGAAGVSPAVLKISDSAVFSSTEATLTAPASVVVPELLQQGGALLLRARAD